VHEDLSFGQPSASKRPPPAATSPEHRLIVWLTAFTRRANYLSKPRATLPISLVSKPQDEAQVCRVNAVDQDRANPLTISFSLSSRESFCDSKTN
jgi:hypothetical protein